MMNDQIKILQHNVNGQRGASQQLREYCKVQKISLVLVQELVYREGKVYGFKDCRTVPDKSSPGAVVLVLDNDLPIMDMTVSVSKYIAMVKIGRGTNTATLISAYFITAILPLTLRRD